MRTIFDKKILPEFEAIKDDDENFIWIGKPELKSFLAYKLIVGMLGIGFVIAVVMFNIHALKEDPHAYSFFVYFFLAFIFVPVIFKYFAAILSYKNTIYGFSNRRIMIKSGFISTDIKMIDYDKIVNIEVKVNPIDRIFNTGTIKFFSGIEKVDDEGSSTKLYDEWHNIENVYEILKQVKKAMVDTKRLPTNL